MSKTCLTHGAVYSIDVTASRVTADVWLPTNVKIRDQSRMRKRVHDAMERALSEAFPGHREQKNGD